MGHYRKLRVSGFGIFDQGLNGDYALDMEVKDHRIYRRTSTMIGGMLSIVPSKISLEGNLWVLTSEGGHCVKHTEEGTVTPCGSYENEIKVEPFIKSPSLISSLAFPAPCLDHEYYAANGGVSFAQHTGFLMLRTYATGERVSAIHLKR